MQKLEKRNTYTPTNTSLVRSNCDLELNRDESLSVQGLKTYSNNLKETQSQHKGKQDSRVPVVAYVLSRNGDPLMPTSPCKANRLLKAKRAKVIKNKLGEKKDVNIKKIVSLFHANGLIWNI
jgi:hypothetical protein